MGNGNDNKKAGGDLLCLLLFVLEWKTDSNRKRGERGVCVLSMCVLHEREKNEREKREITNTNQHQRKQTERKERNKKKMA